MKRFIIGAIILVGLILAWVCNFTEGVVKTVNSEKFKAQDWEK